MSLWLLWLCLPLALLVYSVVRHGWAGALLCAALMAVYDWFCMWGDRRRGRTQGRRR